MLRQPSPSVGTHTESHFLLYACKACSKALSPGLCAPSFLVAPTASSLLLGFPGLQSEGDAVMEAAQLGIRSPSPGARL